MVLVSLSDFMNGIRQASLMPLEECCLYSYRFRWLVCETWHACDACEPTAFLCGHVLTGGTIHCVATRARAVF
jgi:hypothetical protein